MELPPPKCTNCNNNFVLKAEGRQGKGLKVPLLLECGHCFCSMCLQGLSHFHTSTLPCPECRTLTEFKRGSSLISQLSICYYTLGLVAAPSYGLKGLPSLPAHSLDDFEDCHIEEDNKTEAVLFQRPICEECEKVDGDLKCVKCECIFCQPCFDMVHSVSKILRSHTTMPLESNLLSPSEEEILLINDLSSALKEAEKNMSTLERHQAECVKQMKSLHEMKESTWRKYSYEKRQLKSSLEARDSTIYREFNLAYDSQASILRDHRRELTSHLNSLHQDISKAKRLINFKQKFDQESLQILTKNLCKPFESLLVIPKTRPPVVVVDSNHFSAAVNEAVYIRTDPGIEQPLIVFDETTDESEDHEIKTEPAVEQLTTPSLPIHVIVQSSDKSDESSVVTKNVVSHHIKKKRNNFLSPNKFVGNSPNSSHVSSCTSSRGSSPYSLSQGTNRISEGEMDEAVDVLVSHVETPSEFYVQYKKDKQLLNALNDQVQKHCSSYKEEAKLQPGVVCGVLRNDVWRRAKIQRIIWGSPSYALVQFVDYGNSDMVSLEDLTALLPDLISKPSFAHKASLFGIQPISQYSNLTPLDWNQTATSYFKTVSLNQEGLKMKVKSINNKMLVVELYMPASVGGLSIGKQLLSQGKAERARTKKQKLDTDVHVVALPPVLVPPIGTSLNVDMITATTPHDFYVLPVSPDVTNQLEFISSRINASKSSWECLSSSSVELGLICLAPYQRIYYRAKIIDCYSVDTYKVQFVDYGNTAVVRNKYLYYLDDKQLLTIPPQALHCTLCDVTWTRSTDDWPEPVCERFHQDTTNLEGSLCLTVKGEGDPLPVILTNSVINQSFSSILVSDGMAKYICSEVSSPPPPELPPVGYEGPVVVTHVESPSNFHVQFVEGRKLVQDMESSLHIPPPSVSFNPSEGDYCLALFHADHQYHRGCISRIVDGQYHVLFIDYGNLEPVPCSDLAPIPSDICALSAQALPCTISDLDNTIPLTYELSIEFSRLVIDKEMTMVVKDICFTRPVLSVDLFINGHNISEFINLSPKEEVYTSSPAITPPPESVELTANTSLHSLPFSISTPSISSSPSPPLLSGPQETFVSKSPKSPSLASSSSRSSKASSRASSRRGGSQISSYSPGLWPPSPFDVIVTSVSETGMVYGQPLNCAADVAEVEQSIKKLVGSSQPITSITSITQGQACMAKYHLDECWYRSVVVGLNMKTNKIKVHFVDYGNTEEVFPNDVIDVVVAPHIPILVVQLNLRSESKASKLSLVDKIVTVTKSSDGTVSIKEKSLHSENRETIPLPNQT